MPALCRSRSVARKWWLRCWPSRSSPFFGWAGTALMAVTVVALLWSSFGWTGSGRVSRIPFEYDGAQLYERWRKALRVRQSGIDLKLPQSRCRDHLHEKAVRDLRRTAFSSRCRPIAGSPRRRLVDRELRPKPVSFDRLGPVPAREQIVHCLIPTGERKPWVGRREMKSAAMKFAPLEQPIDTLPRYRGSVANRAWRSPFAPVFRRGVTCVVGASMRSSINVSLYQIAHLRSFAIWALFQFLISLIGTIVPICVEHRPIKLTAPARRRPVVLWPAGDKGISNVHCGAISSERQPNSGRSSPTHRVRRTKRGSSAISSRATRGLPKTKNGWLSISIRRFNRERTTTVPPLLRKKSKFWNAWARPCLCAGILFPRSSNGSSSTAPAPSAICSKQRRSRDG